jgi:uncharacterized damage-inducible protein DinB
MLSDAIHANIILLRQGLALLGKLNPDAYATPVPACFHSTPGAHFRHVIDHYQGLFRDLADGRLDYERRARSPDLEASPMCAAEALQGIMDGLSSLPAQADRPLALRAETSGLARPEWAATSLRRELEFILSHTVHHYALIAVMCRLLGIETDPEFGLAPSTLRHLDRLGEVAGAPECAH